MNITRLIIMFILVLMMTSCSGKYGCIQWTREIEIIVVDDLTGNPLPNIIVYYTVKKGQMQRLVDSTFFRIVEKQFKTDENGICIIPQKRYFRWPIGLQFIASDTIAINLDVDDEIKQKYACDAAAFWSRFHIYENFNVEYFYIKNENYKGFVIFSQESKLEKFHDFEKKREYNRFDLLFNYNLTGNQKDKFVVRLRGSE